MKRNWKVVRIILEQVEKETLADFIRTKQYLSDAETADADVLLGHVEIMIDAGILKNCRVTRGSSGHVESWDLRAPFITMYGHDLLDALRDETVWNRLTSRAKQVGVSLSWEFIKAAIPIVMTEIVSSI